MSDRLKTIIEEICCQHCDVSEDTLAAVIMLAVEIAREGREGRKIGTVFTVGDEDAVVNHSRSLVLDPLFGHPREVKHIEDDNVRETVKEFAQLDGGFIVADDGTVLSAARYFDATSEGIDLPLGLGSRHMAGASISRSTGAVAVVVSESSIVRVFDDGRIISEIIPELWMLRRHGLALQDGAERKVADDVMVVGST